MAACTDCERMRGVETEVEGLKEWRDLQSGTIQAVDKKVDRLIMWMLGTATLLAVNVIVGLILVVIQRGAKS